MNFDFIIGLLFKYKLIKENRGFLSWIKKDNIFPPELESYVKEYPDERTFLFCMTNRIAPDNIPRCPICGEKVTITVSGKKEFNKTCGKIECKNKLREIRSLERYGVKNISQADEVKKKKEDLSLAKFGTKTPLQNREVKGKIKESLEAHHGLDWKKVLLNKRKNTCLEKYGVDNPSKLAEVKSKKCQRYHYDGYSFRSSYELAFYIYYRDKGCDIKYESIKIPYGDHIYTPDFVLDGRLIEIKGKHLLDEEGNIDSSFYGKSKEEEDRLKQECMNENNVELITDVSKEIDYVKSTYGYDFMRSCK